MGGIPIRFFHIRDTRDTGRNHQRLKGNLTVAYALPFPDILHLGLRFRAPHETRSWSRKESVLVSATRLRQNPLIVLKLETDEGRAHFLPQDILRSVTSLIQERPHWGRMGPEVEQPLPCWRARVLAPNGGLFEYRIGTRRDLPDVPGPRATTATTQLSWLAIPSWAPAFVKELT